MLIKLIIRNVNRNIQTYTIYFLTLSLIYCILYGFNAIPNHPIMSGNEIIQDTMLKIMSQYMGLFSFIVSLAVSFLIIYATNFVLQRRKRELGLYASLGLKNSKIGLIIFGETSLISLGALVIGSVMGQFLLLGLSYMAGKIFIVNEHIGYFFIDKYSLIILGITYLLSEVLILMLIIIRFRKKRIISLLQEMNIENKSILNKYPQLKLVIFIFSVMFFIWVAYILREPHNILLLKKWYYVIVPTFSAVTIAFFITLNQTILSIYQNNKHFYYKGYRTFKVRQLSCQANKNSIALAVLSMCLTLVFTIVLLGGSAYSTMKDNIAESTPFDFTISKGYDLPFYQQEEVDILKVMEMEGLDKDKLRDTYQFNIYNAPFLYDILLNREKLWQHDKALINFPVLILKLSDYNKILEMQGKKTVDLRDNEFIINANYKGTIEMVKDYIKSNPTIIVNQKKLHLSKDSLRSEVYYMTSVGNNDRGTFILPDKYVEGLKVDSSVLIGDYSESTDRLTFDKFLDEWIEKYTVNVNNEVHYEYKYQSSSRLTSMYTGFMGVLVFVLIFIGIIFLIISLSVLSIQASTASIDSKNNYNSLSLLGTPNNKIKRIIYEGNFIHFMIPCILAIPLGIIFAKVCIAFFANFMNTVVVMRFEYLMFVFSVFSIYLIFTNMLCKKIIE
ncbi:ABC transporter permease [Atopobacter phocae]|uniref:ABC transporter permease n=1 Tax=Atopobacter phocae TaxID=136492 RepID=UPI000470394E|nr:ABC transporter permease [Atopobacter phocae]